MTSDEYIEKIVSEAYKLESDREENLVRSLPFVAASLAVIATVIGFIRPALPVAGLSAFSIFYYVALTCALLGVLLVIAFLLVALWPRRFDYFMKESSFVEFATQLRKYHSDIGLKGEELERAVVADLRQAVITQYTTATVRNRSINVVRSQARGGALICLLVAFFCAFALIGSILFREARIKGVKHGAEAATSTNAGGHKGRLDVEGGAAAGQPAATTGTTDTEPDTANANAITPSKPKSEVIMDNRSISGGNGSPPAPAPAPAAAPATNQAPAGAPAKPATPPMQSVFKGTASGDMKKR